MGSGRERHTRISVFITLHPDPPPLTLSLLDLCFVILFSSTLHIWAKVLLVVHPFKALIMMGLHLEEEYVVIS